MNGTLTSFPTCNVMSSVGTDFCGIGQTVGTSFQSWFPSPSWFPSWFTSWFQPRPKLYKTSSYQETDIKNSKNTIYILKQERDDYLFGLRIGTRNECLSYTPEMMYSPCSHSVVQSSLDLPRLFHERGLHTDLPSDTLRINFLSLLNECYSGRMIRMFTISPTCPDEVSFVGTHVCEIGQTVRLDIQLYPRPCESSYDQVRGMNRSSCSTIDWNCIENCVKEISSIRKLIPILEQERRKLLHDLCGLANGTRVECRSYTPETSRRMYLHWTASKCSESHSENSIPQESIHILEQETRKCVDDHLIGLENETRNECVWSIPEKCSRMDSDSTPRKCSESNFDLIADVSKKRRIQYKKRIQSSLEFRTYVKRASHIVLHREKFSYDHHILILYVNGNLTQFLEYGFPEGLINIIDTLSETSLGRIQYKTITIEELFQPNTSKVYLVYSPRYPKTTKQLNTAIERGTSRIGEKKYYLSHSNCEHLVIWTLEGNSTSSQWRDAGVLRRAAGDVVEKILPVVVANGTNYLLHKLYPNVPNVPPNEDSINLSPPEDETKKRSINDPAAPNQKCSKLSTMLKAFKSCITAGNTKLAMLFLLVKLLIFFMNLYLSPGGYSFVIIMAVIVRTLNLFFGPRFLLLEIDKLLLIKFMSCADIFREVFKMIFVYFASMTEISCILTILETFVLCLYQLTCYILAGILFDAFIYPLFHFLLIL